MAHLQKAQIHYRVNRKRLALSIVRLISTPWLLVPALAYVVWGLVQAPNPLAAVDRLVMAGVGVVLWAGGVLLRDYFG